MPAILCNGGERDGTSLIPEFTGDSAQDGVEWLEKTEFVCNLRGIAHLERIVPLRLTGIML